MIDFAGWRMPVQYTSILEEHRAVRERVGLFDLSHMGELLVEGPDAGEALAGAVVTNPPALAVGRAHYSMICAADGGIIDDLIIYRLADDRFMVVANAGNAQVVSDALAERLGGAKAVLDDQSLATGLVAVQGPRSVDVLAPAHRRRPRRRCATTPSPRAPSPGSRPRSARTGYTGEDGFEVFVETRRVGELWDVLLDAVRGADGVPVGLGARDTLRLEAGMPLYGNELDRTTNPFDAGLGRVVKLDKPGDFVGRAALERVAAEGPEAPGRPDHRRPRHRPPRLPGPRRGATDRRRDQRDAVADARRPDRDGLRRPGRRRARDHARNRDPRHARPRAGRPLAVLSEEHLT